MKPHYRIVKPLGERWSHCIVLPERGWDERHGFHCMIMMENFGDVIRFLSKMMILGKENKQDES